MKQWIFILFAWTFVARSSAQEVDSDTGKVYSVPEVVVTATRSPIPLSDSPSPVTVITLQDIERMNAITLADVLQSSGGVILNDQGGQASLKTVSLRGMSSYHVLVLVDGTRLNSFQNGLVDLSLLPVGNIERIEIVRGGSSALYGADALGGVINVFTKRGGSDLSVRTEGSAGSFGFQRYAVEGQGTVAGLRFVGGHSHERGKDDYPFVYADTTIRRENADFRRLQSYLSGSVVPDEHSSLTITAQRVKVDRGTPGMFFGPGSTSMARQSDDDINVVAQYVDSHLERTEFELHAGFHDNLQRYVDPNPAFPFDSYYRNRFFTLNPQARVSLSSTERLVVGAEFAQGVLHDVSSATSRAFDPRIIRVQKSLYMSHESRLEFQRPLFDRLSLYQTVRYDGISDVAHAVTPKLGINVRVVREGAVHLRSSIGQSFRAPTFNDLYYRGFSNPDLKPERSTSFDVGVTSEVDFHGWHALEVSYFHLDTENRIQFDLVSFKPVNIGRALSRGIETKYTGQFLEEFLEVGVWYTFNDARKKDRNAPNDPTYDKQLKFIPKHLAHFTLSLNAGVAGFTIVHSIVGSRFTTDDNSASLNAYRLTHANVVTRVPFGEVGLQAKLEVNNLFDRGYEVFPQYPMPKRNYRATISVSL